MPEIKDQCATLRNGQSMPLLGLGCWQSMSNEVEKAVEVALDNGYRHIDTAFNYLNEAEVGKGIHNWIKKDSKRNKREDLFIVTKLPGIGMSPEGVRKFLTLSLTALQLSYVDLYLVHTPVGFRQGKNDQDVMPFKSDGLLDLDDGTDLIAVWKEMEKMVDEGKAKSIGVSNFSIKQLRKMEAISRIQLVTNQVELHAAFQQKELVDYCAGKNIVITAYAPLGSPDRSSFKAIKNLDLNIPLLLDNPVVVLISENHKVTTAQVLIRFLIQLGCVTIPKSVTPHRIISNADVFSFELSDTEMAALKTLDKGEAARSFNFGALAGMGAHPECSF